jgi:multicomponent Na+:H+ antiporter subunit G
MIDIMSNTLIGIGLVFWLRGTFAMLRKRSVLYKLHYLSVADTLGSITMIAGLLLKIPREWPLLILAVICLAIWNTMLGYVIAHCAGGSENEGSRHGG